jgi:hypothetical protein
VDDGLCEEGVGAAEGVCVAGVSEVFLDVSVDKTAFLCFLVSCVVFFVDSTEVMIFWS